MYVMSRCTHSEQMLIDLGPSPAQPQISSSQLNLDHGSLLLLSGIGALNGDGWSWRWGGDRGSEISSVYRVGGKQSITMSASSLMPASISRGGRINELFQDYLLVQSAGVGNREELLGKIVLSSWSRTNFVLARRGCRTLNLVTGVTPLCDRGTEIQYVVDIHRR